ncbi:hypothetical protein QQ020_33345 [Fulvivirgaceae bacterium BMA12]|uniref:Lipid/polyisoprenoid-binding YceI-like domain-containing protein n=1 Tax=Agaribacillus aureus TaxID=3051825 RepID=A0ABT8LGR7_9BACT|nr:hypothetical protein [Fulvivirgaceae bacterium BMA12]
MKIFEINATAYLVGLLIVLQISLSGCEKRRFEFVVDVDHAKVFVVDETGPFTKSGTITEQDILSELDIPDDATVTKVDIKTLVVLLEPDAEGGNEATSITLAANIKESGNTEPLFDGSLYSIPVPFEDVNIPFVGKVSAQRLVDRGVAKLRGKINGYLNHLDDGSFEIEINGDAGTDKRLRVLIGVEFVATVTYEECIETVFGAGGEECSI